MSVLRVVPRLLKIAVVTAVVLAALPLRAQLITDRVPRERTIPLREAVKQQAAESRWRLGPFRVQPRFTLSNAGYVDNLFGTEEDDAVEDWTATVGAGLDVLMPMGRKLFLRGSALPEYTWYAEHADMRNLGGSYSGSALALFNRMSVEATAESSERLSPVSSETERDVVTNVDRAIGRLEIDVLERLSLFGAWEGQERRYEETAPDELAPPLGASRLGRDDTATRAGIRYRFRPHFDVSAAAEETTSEFAFDRELDFDTEAALVGIHYDRPRFYIDLSGGRREGTPRGPDSKFVAFDELTGSYFLSWQLARRMEIQGFGERSVVPSISTASSWFLESRNGVGLQWLLGGRITVRMRGERGKNEYTAAATEAPLALRVDDVTRLGGGLGIRLVRGAVLNVDATRTEYESTFDGYDRSVVRIMTGISFTGAPNR